MSPEEKLFHRCLEHAESEWDRLLDECTDDPALRRRVRKLLDAHERASDFESVIIPQGELPMGDPDTIGPFRVLEKLAEGGMGVVYLAEQKKPVRRRVAIKIIRPGMASSEVINRFNAERQALALMTHPGIARILDAGATEQGLPYFVMEYVPGIPIIRYCDRHKLNLRRRVELLREVCSAVQHAHQKGVIHRDLKPSNILVIEEDGRPVPKIIDFGIAKAMNQPLTERTLHTRAGLLVGTPDYMSPEQCSPGNFDIDTRSDVYSLGAVLYQLLSGRLPYDFRSEKISELEILQRIREQDPPPPSHQSTRSDAEDAGNRGLDNTPALKRLLRGELDWIVMKALERDRNRRYESAQALSDDLQRYLDNEPLVAGPPTIRYRTGKFIRRHALGVTMLASAFIMITAFAGVMAWQAEQTRRERDRANAEASTSAYVTQFLLNTFRVPDGTDADAGRIALRALLDRSRGELERNTELDTDIRLHLYSGLGRAYSNIGLHRDAVAMYRQALDMLPSHASASERIRLHTILADALRLAHETREARELLLHTFELAETIENRDSELLIGPRLVLVSVEQDLGNLNTARDILEPLYAESMARYPVGDQRTFHLGAQLVRLYCLDAEIESAAALANELLTKASTVLGEDDPFVYQMLNSLGWIAMTRGQRAEAERIYRKIHEHNLAFAGPESSATQDAAVQLAATLDDDAQALEILLVTVKTQEKRYGTDAPQLVATLTELGSVYSRIPGREEDARRSFDHALEIAERHHGEHHLASYFVHYDIAASLARHGRLDEAISHLQKIDETPILQYQASRDPDFNLLRQDKRFTAWLGKFGADDAS